ncbi:hypothetical protein [Stagnihabitans tardus]|uniref:Apolipoprotein acyltransferase n=1 Tax=Stagnihabitans tardus TaxID=2699202 RepID=A0AAE4Y7Q4_9RHOB|nr:hypothetical protein [Stagnihabitans tardus]NBZ87462.1 hypothetical protein [Stagnihabitans tardus]
MMWLVIAGAAAAGAFFARKKGGRGVDMAQYAAVWGICAALASLVVVVFVSRLLN